MDLRLFLVNESVFANIDPTYKALLPSEFRVNSYSDAMANLAPLSSSDQTRKLVELSNSIQSILSDGVRGFVPLHYTESSFPHRSLRVDSFVSAAGGFFGILLLLCYFYPLTRLVKMMMYEKHSRIKEGAMAMGLRESVIMPSWFTIYTFQFFITSLITAGFACLIWTKTGYDALLLLFFLFSVATIAYAVFIQSFFSEPKLAAVLSAIVYLAFYFPFAFSGGENGNKKGSKTFNCLFAPSCLSEGIYVISQFQNSPRPISSVSEAPLEIAGASLSMVYGMLLFDIIFFTLLGTYFEKVIPKQWGVPEKWYYLFTKRFWCSNTRKLSDQDLKELQARFLADSRNISKEKFQGPLIEDSPEEWQPAVELRGLRKTFKASGKSKEPLVAVDDSWMRLYEGQILALLGHNGAGKTTTISMLTGMLPVTEGDAVMYGLSVAKGDMDRIRKFIGFCPQHDIIFPDLTVREHMEFYATVKDVDHDKQRAEIDEQLELVGLLERDWQLAMSLSGGQKRRLSVAIALLGGSKVVFLDEPSTGVDPFMRHQLWDALKAARKGRVIILTTHFMEEADYLGDRIAIMANGKVQCLGGSLFLKSKYGAGHTLAVNKIDASTAVDQRITQFVKSKVPEASVVVSVGAEVQFRLPFGHTGIADILEVFEGSQAKDLGVRSFALGVTSLEEVFLKAGAHGENGDVTKIKSHDEEEKDNFEFRTQSKELLGLPVSNEEYIARRMSTEITRRTSSQVQHQQPALLNSRVAPTQFGKSSSIDRNVQNDSFATAAHPHSASPVVKENNTLLAPSASHNKARPISATDEQGSEPRGDDVDIYDEFGSAESVAPEVVAERTDTDLWDDFKSRHGSLSVNSVTKSNASSRTSPGPRVMSSSPSHGMAPPTQRENQALMAAAKAARLEDELSPEEMMASKPSKASDGNDIMRKLSFDVIPAGSTTLFFRHIKALLIKKAHSTKRDKKSWICQVLLPAIFILISLAVMNIDFTNTQTVLLRADNDLLNLGKTSSPFIYDSTNAATCFTSAANGSKMFNSVYSLPAVDVSSARVTYDNSFSPVTDSKTLSRYLIDAELNDNELGVLNRYVAYNIKDCSFPSGAVPSSGSAPYMNFDFFYNTTSVDAPQLGLTEIFNNWLRAALGLADQPDGAIPKLIMTISNLPFGSAANASSGLFSAMFIGMGFAYIPAFWGLYAVREKETKSKHMQFVSGVSIPAYWVSNAIWDLIFYIIPLVLTLIFMGVFGSDLVIAVNFGWTLFLLIAYAWCAAGSTYLLSFLFESHVTAQNVLSILYILTGAILLMVSWILEILPSTKNIYKDVLQWIFYLFPNFCLARGLANVIMHNQPSFWNGRTMSPGDLEVSGYALIYMLVCGSAYFGLTIACEYFVSTPKFYAKFTTKKERVFQNLIDDKPDSELDSDVAAERRRILNAYSVDPSFGTGDIVQVIGLQKCYPTKPPRPAVKSVYFGIPEGECFGYLGVNGAGKTTTLRMLTGDEVPTFGTGLLGGKDVLQQQTAVRQLMGYCPQFDALIGELSARETLWLYARVKGFPEDKIGKHVDALIEKLSLQEYADRPCGSYSGGNKRKLSVGIALIGNPMIVFLDEPTSGVDPASRKFMWNLISTTMKGRSVVLTTHSMDECEALCQRISIMVAGQLKCIGTASHLKAKFGDAYQLELTLHADESVPSIKAVAGFSEWAESKFPGIIIQECNGRHVVYRIPKTATKLSKLFREVEAIKSTLKVRDYSISETSLEQIFIRFAAEDENRSVNQKSKDTPLELKA
eukprot:GDKJ01013442.1.p1 GENE.GDKJ01013442.1~~GDKJ01013442.1.p1  ORF type:complete len:2069 (-),score=472.48 GDKJ01013442.1:1176-6494(-)